MFLIGCVVFLMAFARAVQRSRTDAIGIGGLYFLAGSVAPNQVTRTFNGLLAVQCVAAVTGAAIRPYSAMAFGVLAPMLGLALSGLWGAKYGVFGSRSVSRVVKEREAASDRPE